MFHYVSMRQKTHVMCHCISYLSFGIQIYVWYASYTHIDELSHKIAYVILFPFYILMSSFFVFYLFNILYGIVVPRFWIEKNSKYMSFHPPPLFFSDDKTENHEEGNEKKKTKPVLTIQIPVYTETFQTVLKPTLDCVLSACRHYNKQINTEYDGCVNVFINDDGLQVVDEKEKNERMSYYNEHDEIFYVARPKENRKGRFKKASNMNFALSQYFFIEKCKSKHERRLSWLSNSLEKKFLYKHNYSDFELGEFILLLDSDSRMNANVISYFVEEMKKDENIGFLQMRTNSLLTTSLFWEKMIAHFTNNIYNINFLYSCSNGHPAPLVGHNVVLRVDTMKKLKEMENTSNEMNQKISDKSAIEWMIWDNDHVSEDFVMSLNMQFIGYYGKYIFYDCGMMEGVTLNMMDELMKLEKYMYGIMEIMFHPFNKWTKEGIFSSFFCELCFSDTISFSTKYALMSYVGSYFAISFSPFISMIFYFHEFFKNNQWNVFFQNALDNIYVCGIIFFALSILNNISINWKHKFNPEDNLWKMFWREIYFGFFMAIFFSSIPFHFIKIIFVYLLDMPISWKTTNKENGQLSFWNDILFSYKWMNVLNIFFICMIVFFYITEQIQDVKSIAPFSFIVFSHLFANPFFYWMNVLL